MDPTKNPTSDKDGFEKIFKQTKLLTFRNPLDWAFL